MGLEAGEGTRTPPAGKGTSNNPRRSSLVGIGGGCPKKGTKERVLGGHCKDRGGGAFKGPLLKGLEKRKTVKASVAANGQRAEICHTEKRAGSYKMASVGGLNSPVKKLITLSCTHGGRQTEKTSVADSTNHVRDPLHRKTRNCVTEMGELLPAGTIDEKHG